MYIFKGSFITLNTTILFTLFVLLFTNDSNAQFKPIVPDVEGIYLCEPISVDFPQKYISRSTLDSTVSTPNGDAYFPFRTLTDRNNHYPCEHIATNNWLGNSITHDTNLNAYVFEFQSIKYNSISDNYQLSVSLPFSIPDNLIVGQKFDLNTLFEGEVVSQKFISWNNTQIEVQTIEITNPGNPNFNWQKGQIIISKDYGLFNFPNLQYFPYEWRNCTLVGLTEPKIGVQDIPNKAIYRMAPGDEYTAERSYTYAGPNFDIYYERQKCLSVTEENDTSQKRIIQREIVRLTPLKFIWTYKIDTLEQNIIYDNLPLNGSANQTIHNSAFDVNLIIVNEQRFKFSRQSGSWDQNECFGEMIDGCNGNFSFEGGLALYYDCSLIFNFTDYYLPRHRIVNGIETGTSVNFDSLLLDNKVISLTNVNIYPNPSNGDFSLDLPDNIQMDHFMLTGLTGSTINLKPVSRDSKTINFKQSLSQGIYILHGLDKTGKHYSLGKISVI